MRCEVLIPTFSLFQQAGKIFDKSSSQGLSFVNQLATCMSFQNTAPRFLSCCNSDKSLLLFKIQNTFHNMQLQYVYMGKYKNNLT